MLTPARRLIPLVFIALLFNGCAHHRLTVAEPNPYGDYHRVTTHAFLWGAIERTEVASECETNLLNDVHVITSLAQALGTVITAGLWMPSTIQYKCAKRPSLLGSAEE